MAHTRTRPAQRCHTRRVLRRCDGVQRALLRAVATDPQGPREVQRPAAAQSRLS